MNRSGYVVVFSVVLILATDCTKDKPNQPPTHLEPLISTWELPSWPEAMAFDPSGSRLAVQYGLEVSVFKVPSGEAIFDTVLSETGMYSPSSISFSPDGALVAAGYWDTVYLLDSETGHLVHSLSHGEELSIMTSIVFSPDGALLYVGGQGASISVWNVETGLLVARRIIGDDAACVLSLSPDGNLLATGSRVNFKHVVDLWDPATFTHVGRCDADSSSGVFGLALDPKHGMLFSSGWRLYAWRLSDLSVAWSITDFNSYTGFSLRLSPDGGLLALPVGHGIMRLIDPRDGSTLFEWVAHDPTGIWDCQFTPDGSIIATAGNDQRVRLWRVASLKEQ
jgi:WD40 repeat protein